MVLRRRTIGAPLLLTAALLLAACGSGDGSVAAAPPAADTVAADTVEPAAVEATTVSIAAATTSADLAGHGPGHEAGHEAGHDGAAHAAALPSVEVVRVNSGEKVALSSLHTAGKPTLLWFWAPHCTFCRAEAPKLKEFAAKYGTKVAILGLGAQDDLDQARGFCAETGTTALEMVWDASGKSWLHYKVTNQPTVIVLDKDGKVVKTFFRKFDEREILAAAGVA